MNHMDQHKIGRGNIDYKIDVVIDMYVTYRLHIVSSSWLHIIWVKIHKDYT